MWVPLVGPSLAQMHACLHTGSHAISCLRVFAQGVFLPKMPSPSLATHLHPSHPSNLCLSHIWSCRGTKLLPVHYPPVWNPWHCICSLVTVALPLLVKRSNFGQVPAVPGAIPPAWNWCGLNSHAELLFCPTLDFTVTRLAAEVLKVHNSAVGLLLIMFKVFQNCLAFPAPENRRLELTN